MDSSRGGRCRRVYVPDHARWNRCGGSELPGVGLNSPPPQLHRGRLRGRLRSRL